MFKKLISNISFSPALVGQLSFYAKRLKNEEATRKLGLIFTVLALIVQSFVVFSPPVPANAASSNDFVKGGVKSKSEFLKYYDSNTANLKDIMNSLGVTRSELTAMKEKQTIHDKSTKPVYYSWGHHPQFSYAQGERAYNIPTQSGGTIKAYARPLKLWGANSRQVMTGHSKVLGTFYIMYDCGNLVTTYYPTVQTCPKSYTGIYPNCKAPVCKYDSSIAATNPKCKAPVCPVNTEGTYPDCKPIQCPKGTEGTYPNCKVPPCQLNKDILSTDKNCQPCPGDTSLWIKDESCAPNLIPSKTAINITENSKNASLITAKSNDKIEYHLNVQNTGKVAADAHFTENLDDVLEYATILDTGGGDFNHETNILSWPSVSVAPGETVSRIFSVQIDSPVASVARGISNGTSYDCEMLNTFGNSVTISVDCPAPKVVEQVTSELPHTGASDNIIFAGILLAIVAFFYARSRQLRSEVRLIRRNINSGTL